MEIIDFHTHIYPEKISKKAVESIGEFYNIKMNCDGTSKSLIKIGKKCGVTKYVVHSVAVDEHHVCTINDFIASECNKHKEFIGFSTMHLDFEDKINELERSLSLGLKGVKIHPDTQKFNVDDKKMFDFYDYLSEKEIPILIHCGDYRYDYSHPERIRNILNNFPDLLLIGAHFGGWSVFDYALEFLKDTKCYFDISSSYLFLGPKRMGELIRIYGAERMLFGSDYPMWNVEDELKNFNKLNLTQSERELILYKNSKKILKIK